MSDRTSPEFGATLRELSEVQASLADCPADDIAQRASLRRRENELRDQLRAFSAAWTDHLSIDQIKRKIAELEHRIEDHYGNRLSHTSGMQTGFGGGLDPKVLHEMNRAMDESNDLVGLRAELSRLRDRLSRLESGS